MTGEVEMETPVITETEKTDKELIAEEEKAELDSEEKRIAEMEALLISSTERALAESEERRQKARAAMDASVKIA